MDHVLVRQVEHALGWTGSDAMGAGFAHGRMADRELCARLLTPTGLLDMAMRRSLTAPQFRCFQDGTEVHPARFLTDSVSRRGQSVRMADMSRLARLLESGCTLVLDGADVFSPTLEVACRALQWWSREVVQVNCYLTTQASDGFPLHWDDHDVVIVQLAGEKTWDVRAASRAVPMYRDAAPNDTPSEEVVWSGRLRAGEVMHIPRGYWHRATRSDCGDDYSLHATFGFVKRTAVSWMSWLADCARHQELFRHDLRRGGAGTSWSDELISAAQQLAAEYPPSEFLSAREDERGSRRHVRTRGVFGPPTSVVCITDFPPRLEVADGTVGVVAAGKRIKFAARALPALRMLLSGPPVRLDDVHAQTGVDASRLAEVLIEEEVCAELTEELSSGYTGLVTNATSSRQQSSLVSAI